MRRFLGTLGETLLVDDHEAFRPAVDDVVWLQYKPWRVRDVFRIDDDPSWLNVAVEPIALPQSPACPLPR